MSSSDEYDDLRSVDEEWTCNLNRRVRSSPTISDETLYIGSDDCNLYAIDIESGDILWEYDVDGVVKTSPTIVEDGIVVGSGDGTIHYLNLEDQHVGKLGIGHGIESSPAVKNGVVYVGCEDNNLYAINIQTREIVWTYETGYSIVSSPTVVGDTVYVGSDDRNIHAIDAKFGEGKWSFRTYGWVRSSPTVVEGTLYVGSDDRHLYAIDADSGKELWAYEVDDYIRSSPTIADDTIYVGSDDSYIYAIDRDSGELLWTCESIGYVRSSPTVAGDTLYVGSDDGHIYAIDTDSGEKIWTYETDSSVRSSPTVVEGTLYVGSDDTKMYAIDVGSRTSRDSRVIDGTLGSHDLPIEDRSQETEKDDSKDTDVAELLKMASREIENAEKANHQEKYGPEAKAWKRALHYYKQAGEKIDQKSPKKTVHRLRSLRRKAEKNLNICKRKLAYERMIDVSKNVNLTEAKELLNRNEINQARDEFEEARSNLKVAVQTAQEYEFNELNSIEDKLQKATNGLQDCELAALGQRVSKGNNLMQSDNYEDAQLCFKKVLSDLETPSIDRKESIESLRYRATTGYIKTTLTLSERQINRACEKFEDQDFHNSLNEFERTGETLEIVQANTIDAGLEEEKSQAEEYMKLCKYNAEKIRAVLNDNQDPNQVNLITIDHVEHTF